MDALVIVAFALIDFFGDHRFPHSFSSAHSNVNIAVVCFSLVGLFE